MKVVVCIKQVPVVARMKFDYKTKTVVREGVPVEVNSFDMLAVDKAVQLVEEQGGEVVVVTMGPPQAREALIQCIAMGAHKALHLTDKAFAGADTLATARSLALALRRDKYDLVLCGRHSTDAETGQVGPELAELLEVAYVGSVRKLDYEADGGTLLAERETDDGYEVVRCPLPAVVSVCEGICEERFPNRQQMQAANENPAIEDITAAQLTDDASLLGSAGSPTWVTDIQLIEPTRRGEVIEEEDPKTAAQVVVDALKQMPEPPARELHSAWQRYQSRAGADIWVVADGTSKGLRRSSFEVLGKARELAETMQGEVAAILFGSREEDVRSLAAYGADRVLTLDLDKLGHPSGAGCAAVLAEAIQARSPYAVLFSSTANGRDLASRLAARLSLGLTGDCIDLEVDEEGRLVQHKPALGGNVVAPILSKTVPYMATMRPGLLNPIAPTDGADCRVEALEDSADTAIPEIQVLEVHTEDDARGMELEAAQVVMGVGIGVGGPENLPVIYELAGSLGACVAATRDVTDRGWLPKQLQVGLTGRAISPRLYIAVGIRGDFNHMVGLQKAGTIIAINNNPNPRRAPILQGADFTIVGDWQTYLPPLVEALKPLCASWGKE